MIHSFNTNIAKVVGIKEAILLYNIDFWIAKNKANNKHFYKGHYWTYNSSKAFAELFPYLTQKMIENALTKLIKDGYLIKDCFNENKFDRTAWYALTDKYYQLKGESHLLEKGNVDLPKKETPFTNLGKCIYESDNKPNNKQQIENNKATETEKSALSVKANENAKSHILQSIFSLDLFLPSDNISQADLSYLARYSHLVSKELKYLRELALFILHRKDIKKPLTERALKSILEKLKGFKEPKQALENSIMNGWSGVFENTKPTSKDDFIAKSHNTFDNGDNSLYFRDDGE